ncbi:peptidoglycan DD-metalloendopeptidase family protein [Bradyrhizobium ganzhouense]|uniref:M23 family metallopeptidase n=1 Tax=Bradyrhizobium ganzhouense TaxID=1179767 RepID=UPI003CF851E6
MPEYKYPGYGPTKENWLTPRAKTKGGYHGGSDNPAEPGTPVYAQYGGEIFRTGRIDGYGMSVVVKSKAPDGTVFYQLYGHLGPDQLPAPGTPVVANQPIPGAVIGTTKYVQDQGGLTTGPHLHREIISGKAPLNADPNKRFGIYSSDITHKADPDVFDIDRPAFPYQNGEPKPALPPGSTTAPSRSPQIRPSLPGDTLPTDLPRLGAAPLSSSGMAIPGTEGPTSLGGPNGPALLRAPASSRSQSPGSSSPIVDPAPPPLRFAPEEFRNFGPFAMPGSFGGPGVASAASGMPSGSRAQPSAPARFPLEALLAPDPNRALDQWASPRRDESLRTNPDQAPAGGLLGLIQDYMRNNGY